MSTTPQNVINSAFTVLGVTFPGQTPSTSMSNDAFTRLNEMLANWSIERLVVYGILQQAFSLTNGTNNYTIGPGGSFNTTRPNSIEQANIITAAPSGLRSELKLITTQEWGRIADQSAASAVPTMLYFDGEYSASGTAGIYLWPTPNNSSIQLELFTWQQLPQFVTLGDTFNLPQGYEQAIIYSLALQLSGPYGRPMTPENMQIQQQSKAALMEQNAPPTHQSGKAAEAIARSQVQQQIGSQPSDVNPPLRRSGDRT